MPLYHVQNVFSGGALSPLIWGRIDQPRYQTGARTMRNMLPMPQGGVTRRPGLRFLGMTAHAQSRLIPFVFSATQGRVLEFGNQIMRVWLPDGSMIDQGFPSPYIAADLKELRYAQSADVIYFAHPSYAPRKLSRYADDDWRWTELTFVPDVAAPTKLAAKIVDRGANNGSATRTYTYVVTAVDDTTGQESAASDPVSITAKSLDSMEYIIRLTWTGSSGASYYRVYKKKYGVFGYIGRANSSDSAEGGELTGLKMGALTCGISKFAGSITRTVFNSSCYGESSWSSTSKLTVAASASQNAFIIGDMAFIRVTKTTNTTTHYVTSDYECGSTTSTSKSYFWVMLPCEDDDPSGTYSSYTTGQLGSNANYPSGTVGAYSVAPTFAAGSEYTFDDENIGADTEDTPPEYDNPFTEEGNYPSQVFFHQQRLGWASTTNRPITIWLSKSGEFESLATSTPPKDDDAIEVTLAATQANRICWLQPDRTSLAFGTESGEWTLAPSEGIALTPTSLGFQLQTSVGGDSAVASIAAGVGVLYLQRGSKAVRQFAYNYSADKYLGQDLNILARHVLQDTAVTAWAYQQEPYSVIWCVLDDGTLAGLTYMPEQDVVGWHSHDTQGQFKDVVSIPGTPDDQVWFLIQRDSGLCLERLETFFNSDDLADANFLDSALRYDGPALDVFTGLDHLAGRSVSVFADGGSIDGLAVGADGSITLPRAAQSVCIGLPYASRLVPDLPEAQTQQGSTMMHNRKITAVRLRVCRSMSFLAGVDKLFPVVDRHIAGGVFNTAPFYSAATDLHVTPCSGWDWASPLTIEVSTPTPLTILAMLTSMEVAAYSGKGGN